MLERFKCTGLKKFAYISMFHFFIFLHRNWTSTKRILFSKQVFVNWKHSVISSAAYYILRYFIWIEYILYNTFNDVFAMYRFCLALVPYRISVELINSPRIIQIHIFLLNVPRVYYWNTIQLESIYEGESFCGAEDECKEKEEEKTKNVDSKEKL